MAAHIVDYETWCPKCKYFEQDEVLEPCHHCLGEPVNDDSRKPVDWQKDGETKNRKG